MTDRASETPVRRLLRKTIWHEDAIPASEGQASRELKRYVLPAFDVLLIVMAITAIRLGMPSFDIVYNAFFSTVASWALLLAAVTAFVGLAFPRLWALEAAGKLLMILVIGGYAGALWSLVAQGADGRGVVACAFTGLLFLPMWNLARIGRERWARKRAEEVATEAITVMGRDA